MVYKEKFSVKAVNEGCVLRAYSDRANLFAPCTHENEILLCFDATIQVSVISVEDCPLMSTSALSPLTVIFHVDG
jgi:hypothetical protein